MTYQKVVAHSLGWRLRDSKGFAKIQTADGAWTNLPAPSLGGVAALATILNAGEQVAWDAEAGALVAGTGGPALQALDGGDGPFPVRRGSAPKKSRVDSRRSRTR